MKNNIIIITAVSNGENRRKRFKLPYLIFTVSQSNLVFEQIEIILNPGWYLKIREDEFDQKSKEDCR